MKAPIPDYLQIPADMLGVGTPVRVVIGKDMADIAERMAATMFDEIVEARRARRAPTFIVPVGPVDQFPVLARRINSARLDCRDLMLINMDEYLIDSDGWIPIDHPLSFRGYMQRLFYDLVDPVLAPVDTHRIFPDPNNCQDIQARIADRGGVDVCFGGIGINGHIAFNEPPALSEQISTSDFAALPTRVLDLTPETRTINSVTVGGEISIIPRRAVTVGMKECLAARKLRFFCNRPWQSAVVRRALHGPVTPACPSSLLRLHKDAVITVANYVATPPEIKLR